MPLSLRHRVDEWMDAPDADPQQLRLSLRYLRRINTLLRYNAAVLGHFKRFSRSWRPGERVTLLDVATGSADLPRAVRAWGERHGFDIAPVGLDRHAMTAKSAADSVAVVRADALALPFADASVDYVTCGLFLHHLDEDAAVAALREMGRVARRGVVVADLLRRRRAYAWITLLSLFANPMVRHDARASVAGAFDETEARRLRERAGLDFTTYREHFAHRFTLAGEK